MGTETSPLGVVERYRDAYNAKDFAALAETLAPEIELRHHNRGVELHGREACIAVIGEFEAVAPDRRLTAVRRQVRAGETVVVEHGWEGTLTADIEGFGAAGETVRIEICTVFQVRDGAIVKYDDYG